MSSLFVQIKSQITARQAAEHYGVHVSRSGMACCIFHNDRHPSLKIDTRYYCFSCHETGDVIDFTAKLFGLSLWDAARKLVSDFCIAPLPPGQSAPILRISPAIQERKEERYVLGLLVDYERFLKNRKEEFAPTPDTEFWDERFVRAVRDLAPVSAAIDALYSPDPDVRKDVMDQIRQAGLLSKIEAEMNENIPEVKKDDGENKCTA